MTAIKKGGASAALASARDAVIDNPASAGKFFEAIATVATSLRDIAVSRTERVRIEEEARVELARVEMARATLLRYLDRSFDERHRNFEHLFAVLDRALAEDRMDAVASVLTTVVALAAESPFKALSDARRAAALIEDREHEHVL